MIIFKPKIFVVISTFLQQNHLITCYHSELYASRTTLRTTSGVVEPRIIDGLQAMINEYLYFVPLHILTDLIEYEWSICGAL